MKYLVILILILSIISATTAQFAGEFRSTSNAAIRAISQSGRGVHASSTTNYAVYGLGGTMPGVRGESIGGNGIEGYSQSGGVGVRGESMTGYGVQGQSTDSYGIDAFSENSFAVRAITNNGSAAVFGFGNSNHGVWGSSTSKWGVYGSSNNNYGVFGTSINGAGAFFQGGNGIAIELGGDTSIHTSSGTDAVIRSDMGDPHGDLFLVSSDKIIFHLDDDNNTANESFFIYSGTNSPLLALDDNGNLTILGTYSPSSDINRKEHITSIDSEDILNKVASIPISEWQFKGESIRHIGPMAQDFYAAFGLGQGETTISTVDADGVALAAIKALKAENDALNERLLRLEERLDRLNQP